MLMRFSFVLLVLLLAGPTQAISLGPLGAFTCITNNSAADCAIGEAQLSADLTGDVLTITMNGSDAAVVEQVFIEGAGVVGGSFLGGVGIVDFGDAVAGGNLPGGNSIGFDEAINFAAHKPAPEHGIGYHPKDTTVLQVGRFQLEGDPSELRVGVHVIGYGSGGSESFVTGRPGAPVPEPSAALMFGLGTLVVGSRIRSARR